MEPSPRRTGTSRAARLATYGRVSGFLTSLDDKGLRNLLDSAVAIGSGIGGAAMVLEVAGAQVFIKRIALTDLERHPEHVQSTQNLFHLPPFYQYGIGVGSAGFGVWRELAVHRMTTGWVIGNEYQGFPLMYHWRILPGASGEQDDLERAVDYWEGSSAVGGRLEAIANSSASVVLFLEYFPLTLHDWLTARFATDSHGGEAACAFVEGHLRAGLSFMHSRGLLHFDAHFQNILTDGQRLYFSDFGLAIFSGFELAEDESEFFWRHQSYDRTYVATHAVNWLIGALGGTVDKDALLRESAAGKNPVDSPSWAEDIVYRYAPLAVLMNQFYRRLQTESRTTPYPAEQADLAIDLVRFRRAQSPREPEMERTWPQAT
jgi:serine/threonine protein kinase